MFIFFSFFTETLVYFDAVSFELEEYEDGYVESQQRGQFVGREKVYRISTQMCNKGKKRNEKEERKQSVLYVEFF